jgi:redox-sensitive bicupin YhaK (pirin superfamily)
MLKKLPKEKMGTSNLGWLESRFHFSFAEYRNPNNVNFGVLRVLNDDIIHPKSGFDMHPHQNMEIISYIVDGQISHKDSMGNSETLKRGEVQYLSAGDGIFHSEYNLHQSDDLRLLQIWIIPPQKSLPKLYGSHRFKKEERHNKLLNIVSSQEGDAIVQIYQDVKFYVCELESGKSIDYTIDKNRQIYFVQIEGEGCINSIVLNDGDALEIIDEEYITIKSIENSHFLFIDMKKD